MRGRLGYAALVLAGLLMGLVVAVGPPTWALQGVNVAHTFIGKYYITTTTGPSGGLGWYSAPAMVSTTYTNGPARNTFFNQVTCVPFETNQAEKLLVRWFLAAGGPAGSKCALAIYSADLPSNELLPLTKLYADATAAAVDVGIGTPTTSTVNVALPTPSLLWVCFWCSTNMGTTETALANIASAPLGFFDPGNIVPGAPFVQYQIAATFPNPPSTYTAAAWPANFQTGFGIPAPLRLSPSPVFFVHHVQ